MSDVTAPAPFDVESIEGPARSSELVRDEDVLSHELQYALEQVGSTVGVIAVIALVFSQLPRAKRMVTSLRSSSPSAGDAS